MNAGASNNAQKRSYIVIELVCCRCRHSSTNIDHKEYNLCTSSCHEPCFDRRIETSMSFTGLLTEVQRKSFRQALQSGHTDIKFSDFVEDYLQLDLYFEKLAVTVSHSFESAGV